MRNYAWIYQFGAHRPAGIAGFFIIRIVPWSPFLGGACVYLKKNPAKGERQLQF